MTDSHYRISTRCNNDVTRGPPEIPTVANSLSILHLLLLLLLLLLFGHSFMFSLIFFPCY